MQKKNCNFKENSVECFKKIQKRPLSKIAVFMTNVKTNKKQLKKLEGFCTQIASKVSLIFPSTLKNPKLEMRSFKVDVVYIPGRHTVDWYSHNGLGPVNR